MLCVLLTTLRANGSDFQTSNNNPDCSPDIWVEDFDNLRDGTVHDNGSTAWSRNISQTSLGGDDHVEVRNGMMITSGFITD